MAPAAQHSPAYTASATRKQLALSDLTAPVAFAARQPSALSDYLASIVLASTITPLAPLSAHPLRLLAHTSCAS